MDAEVVVQVGGLIGLAGFAAVQIINIIKGYTGWSGGLALLLTYAVCAVLGVLVFAIQGGLANLSWEGAVGALAGIFTLATAIYKWVVEDKEDE